jgi:acetoacetate decarboxylase
MGFRVAEISGSLGAELPGYEREKIDFYFKILPSCTGAGLESDPAFVYCHRKEKARSLRAVDGELKLIDSPLDPIADFPVRSIVSIEYGELASHQTGEPKGTVPADTLLPYVHQRYDDLSVLGAK